MNASEGGGARSGSARELLDLLGGPPVKERADAAKNREKVLAAAAKLFREKGVEAVSMDAIAAEAGVGKGTLFRRFGDKSGLAVALLDERERDLQERILSGPPPLGPGAEPADRLAAFAEAYLDYLFPHVDLVRMSETATQGARYRIGAYRFWHRHVALMIGDARPDADADVLAHVLMAALAAEPAGMLLERYGEARAKRAITQSALATCVPRER